MKAGEQTQGMELGGSLMLCPVVGYEADPGAMREKQSYRVSQQRWGMSWEEMKAAC